ncbi:MAG TPA: M15 family metallopeptidase [Nocardioidaceae bacterium]|nr:M15 family metallopeptidase [Nocardioidaceae bacterium]
MSVRRSPAALSPTRGAALSAVLLLLTPLAACSGDTTAAVQPAAGTPSATASQTTGDPSAGASRTDEPDSTETPPSDPPDGADRERTRPSRKVLEGGGFARAVPGSDAPDRKVDVGPQYAVSADLDIREIERLVKAVERIARSQRVEQPLATGGSVAAAVGTFSYRWFADGTVAPDPGWVADNITYGEVPILGTVQCHKAMLPQLRGALREVVARGLADEVHPEEYGGCYVPRFIGRDPKQGLSLHTWGIAVDLNVPGNQRGVAGEINRDVVAIFKRWGFAWGGDWAWTDPMHFELAELVRTR